MTSQLVIFRAFLFPSPTLNLKKKSPKSTNKKFLALIMSPELGYPNIIIGKTNSITSV